MLFLLVKKVSGPSFSHQYNSFKFFKFNNILLVCFPIKIVLPLFYCECNIFPNYQLLSAIKHEKYVNVTLLFMVRHLGFDITKLSVTIRRFI